jgi:pimeloyl-ACP methyl ester carboxylesterase
MKGTMVMREQGIKRDVQKVNGLNIFYRDSGSGKTPMLCLHGKWGRGETWTDLMSRYADKFRIIAPDQRGHGLSDKPVARYAGADFADDSYELLKTLECLPAIVVGHSIGGRNAAYLAAKYPQAVKALVILDATADGPDNLSNLSPDAVSSVDTFTNDWPTPYQHYQDAVDDLSRRFPRKTNVQYFLDSLSETITGYDFLFSRQAMSAIDEYYEGWRHILKQIQCPVLLVRAEKSWYLSKEEAEKMRRNLRNSTYFEVSNSDHMVYADNMEEFYSGFEKFIMKFR